MPQVSTLPINTTNEVSSSTDLATSEVSQLTSTTTIRKTARTRTRTATVIVKTTNPASDIATISSVPENIQQTFQRLPIVDEVVIVVCLGSLFWCLVGAIAYKIRQRLRAKRIAEGENTLVATPTTPKTPVTPSSAGLKERKRMKQEITRDT